MPMLFAPPRVALTTTVATVYTNAGTEPELVTVTINNIDGLAAANVTACEWLDSSASNGASAIMPVNTEVPAGEGVSTDKVLAPGDSIRASASANGDLIAYVDVVREPV